jgi:prolyl oligopeptidase
MDYPPTPVSEVAEERHGELIRDPYRWLEDGGSEAVAAWTRAQNAYTRAWMDAHPVRAGIRARLAELLQVGTVGGPAVAGGRYFHLRRDGGVDQAVLLVRDGVDGKDRALVDPNQLDARGLVALDWYFPSPDGRLVAYGLSRSGTEESVLHVADVASGAVLGEAIPGTRASEVAWLPDGRGFYYARYPLPGSVPAPERQYHRAIWFHRLGTAHAADPLVFRPEAKEHWPGVRLSEDGRWLLVRVARTLDQVDLWLEDRRGNRGLEPVVQGLPHRFDAEVVRGRLYVRANHRADACALYSAPAERPGLEQWAELVPPRDGAVLDGFRVTRDHLVLSYVEQAASRLRVAPLAGGAGEELPLPGLGSVLGWGSEPRGTELVYGFASFTAPPVLLRVELTERRSHPWAKVEADIAPERFVVEQVTLRSGDGTPVTMFLAHRRDLRRDGQAPAYLTGYGGFGISMTPTFSRAWLWWLEQGGVLAVPQLRGGGEYGEAWHAAGMLDQKQRTFDDAIAAAEWLIGEGYTSPERLAVGGGSNGGLLAGALVTQRPELFAAAVLQVPLLDMLRFHRFRIARLWIPEYGDPDDPAAFRWLRAYSPYHRVRDGVAYPAVLLAAAEGDSRVDPMHARKMAARLQAASSSRRPVLLRVEAEAGHGAGKPLSLALEELADLWAFIAVETGAVAAGGVA